MINRIAIYWHNGRGLGHISRAGNISRALYQNISDITITGVTGSIKGHELLPYDMDFLKLPSLRGSGDDNVFAKPILNITPSEFVRLREQVIKTFMDYFQPQAFIVDHHPQGRRGELISTLKNTYHMHSFLGWKGVPDNTFFENESLFKSSMTDFLLKHYQYIYIYMDPNVFRLEDYYDIHPLLYEKMIYTGYVTRSIDNNEPRDKHQAKRVLGIDPSAFLLTVSFGGAPDIEQRWNIVLDSIEDSNIDIDIVACAAGPYLKNMAFDKIRRRTQKKYKFVWERMLNPFHTWLLASDVVICAGGYNTLAEVLLTRANAIVIPRHMGDLEQSIHAERLERLELLRYINSEDISIKRLSSLIKDAAVSPLPANNISIDLDGANKLANLIGNLL